MLETIKLIILYILALYFIILIFRVLGNIALYIYERVNNMRIINKQLENDSSVLLENRIRGTEELLNLTEEMIRSAINEKLVKCARLNEPYRTIDMDKDAEEIARGVYEAIKNTIIDNEVILNSDYILSYIMSETINLLIINTKKYNDNAYQITEVNNKNVS